MAVFGDVTNVDDSSVSPANNNTTISIQSWLNETDIGNVTGITEKEIPNCQLFLFILYLVLGILCLFGFFGNLISFLVLRKDSSSPVASFLLQMLAIADNTFLAIWMFIYTFRYSANHFNSLITETEGFLYARVYSFPIMYMAQMATIWLTVVIALNRFMAVCLPYRAPTLCTIYNVYKEVIVVAVFSIVYNIPRFLEVEMYHKEDGKLVWNYTQLHYNSVYETLYSHTLYYMFTFVLPVLILTLVNTKVIIAYRATRRRRYRMTSRRTENESNITLVMIIVVVIFMVCQAPARIVQIISNYNHTECTELYYLAHISNTLEILNSSINFVVYFLFRKRFRDILHDNFCLAPFKHTRSNSRVTTTEGLSLVEIEKTNSNLGRNGSQRKTESPCVSQPGSVRGPVEKNHLVAAANASSVPNNHVPVNQLNKSD